MAQQESDFLHQMDIIGRRITQRNQENIAYYQSQIDQYANWYTTPTQTTKPAPQPAGQPEPEPLTSQQIYEISKQGGEQWKNLMHQIQQEWK